MTCTYTTTLGVYLLGSLEPEDRSTFESHLSGCDHCRAELVRLAPLPGLLNQITLADFDIPTGEFPIPVFDPPAEDAELPVPPAESPDPVAESPDPVVESPDPVVELPAPVVVAGEPDPSRADTPDPPTPPRRYWRVAAAAAVVIVLTVGAVVGYQALQSKPGTQVSWVTWSATNPGTGARADVRMAQRVWGTEIQVKMVNVPPGRECKLIVSARTGYRDTISYKEVAGWWGTGHESDLEIPASTSIELGAIDRLQFTDSDNVVLVDMYAP